MGSHFTLQELHWKIWAESKWWLPAPLFSSFAIRKTLPTNAPPCMHGDFRSFSPLQKIPCSSGCRQWKWCFGVYCPLMFRIVSSWSDGFSDSSFLRKDDAFDSRGILHEAISEKNQRRLCTIIQNVSYARIMRWSIPQSKAMISGSYKARSWMEGRSV